jgi:hypothetical protein
MSFAFINIHLDIYRIIIIPHKKDRCFGDEEKFRRKRNFFHASLCTKRRECVFRLRLKMRSFIHSKADCTRIKETKYITRYVQIYISFFHNYITKDPFRIFCRKVYYSNYQASGRHTSASSYFSFVILHILKSRIRKVQISRRR